MPATRQVQLRHGRGHATLAVPEHARVLAGKAPPAIADPAAAVRDALARPIGSPPLADLLKARRPRTCAITISDITRPVPNRVILPALLETLKAHGIPDAQVTIIIGTGMHRPATAAERLELVGEDILQRVELIDHRADAAATLTRVSDDPPVSVCSRFVNADFRIVTGLIEPHFMAGYSGGRKGLCPALVDLATVQRFHGYGILSDPRSAAGVLEGNPCHLESLRVAKIVGVDFLVNVAIGEGRGLAGVYCGDMQRAHLAGVADVARWSGVTLDQPFDLVVTSAGGFPLDQTFYQSVKGMVAALPAAHERSHILILSDCREGVGSKSYTDVMRRWNNDWRGFINHIRTAPLVEKDQWQYQMHARVLDRIGLERLQLACDGLPLELQAKLSVTPIAGATPGAGDAVVRLQRAIDAFVAANPGARIAVIPDGPYTMLVAD